MFTHIVTFKWRDSSVDGSAVAAALNDVASRLHGVHRYLCGPDAGFTPGAYDFAVVGSFKDRDSFVAYRDHPDHQRVLTEMILPNVQSRTVVQIED